MTNEETVEVFRRLHAGDNLRLARGTKLRDQLAARLRTGEKPKSYRLDFIVAASSEVLETLIRESDKFNKEHQDDLISAQDLCDILATTLSRLKKG